MTIKRRELWQTSDDRLWLTEEAASAHEHQWQLQERLFNGPFNFDRGAVTSTMDAIQDHATEIRKIWLAGGTNSARGKAVREDFRKVLLDDGMEPGDANEFCDYTVPRLLEYMMQWIKVAHLCDDDPRGESENQCSNCIRFVHKDDCDVHGVCTWCEPRDV